MEGGGAGQCWVLLSQCQVVAWQLATDALGPSRVPGWHVLVDAHHPHPTTLPVGESAAAAEEVQEAQSECCGHWE